MEKETPLGLIHRNGKLTGTHVRTLSNSDPDSESRWTTTVDAIINGQFLSGTYTTFYTLTDLQDKTIKDGFLCQKMWLTGRISNGVFSASVCSRFLALPGGRAGCRGRTVAIGRDADMAAT